VSAIRAPSCWIDCFVSLGWLVTPACNANPRATRTINVDGTRTVAENTAIGGGVCRETDQARPPSPYGETELSAATIMRERHGVALHVVTAPNSSSRCRWNLLNHSFIRTGLTGEKLWLYVPNAMPRFLYARMDAVCFALESFPTLGINSYNIDWDDAVMTTLKLLLRLRELSGLTFETDPNGAQTDWRTYQAWPPPRQ
jgi:hypothetical protein